MNDLERVHVKLGISGTYWDKRPQYRVEYNDTVVCQGEITGESDVVEYVEFDCEYNTDEVELQVFLTNKTDTDTVQSEDKTTIVRDMLLNIVSCEIDEIDLGNLVYSHSEFVADDAKRPTLKNCVNLGWNGAWCLRWTNPFYIWLLENI
jgi:hypothetical protein